MFFIEKLGSFEETSYICSEIKNKIMTELVVKVDDKSGIEKGLEDIRKGNVFYAKDSEDLIKQILG